MEGEIRNESSTSGEPTNVNESHDDEDWMAIVRHTNELSLGIVLYPGSTWVLRSACEKSRG